MSFFTAINCMDGRTQLPVNEYLRERFAVRYVDTVTEPGPVKILASREPEALFDSILSRVRISLEHHGSKGVALVTHHDCAGNPSSRDEQMRQARKAIDNLSKHLPGITILPLWVDEQWRCTEAVLAPS